MNHPSHKTILLALAIVCLCATAARADDQPAAANQTLEEIAAAEVAALKARLAGQIRWPATAPPKKVLPSAIAQRVFGFAGAAAPAKAKDAKAAQAAKVDATGSFLTLQIGAAVPRVAAQAPDAVQINDAVLQQFVMQYQPLVAAELAFIRQACDDLSPAQRAKIKSASETALKDAATKMAQFQQGGARVAVQANGKRVVRAPNPQPEPAKIIRVGLTQELNESLTEAQLARYNEEATKRLATRKRAAIANVVARLDAVLFLTAGQREGITEAISTNWQDKWENWLMLSMYGSSQYVPQIPDKYVQCLSDEQMAVWRGLQKIEVGFVNFNLGGAVPNDDGWWDDRPPRQKPPAEAVRFINRLLERPK